ncbi:MAG: hypothetical protein H0X66_03165 [Verrucomicrobia bacterium]|nr:hypothetical protein [Verrucomicrobiota bacterium]
MKFASLFFHAALLILFTGCASPSNQSQQRQFLNHYRPYHGHAFEGRSTIMKLGDDSPLTGDPTLQMIVSKTTQDEVRIRFIVNSDASRTWILRQTRQGLHLSHDHRYPDGTEHSQNFYGGYANERGTRLKQFFPADARTIQERPAREINVWSKEFDLENNRYYYRLYLRGELRYEAEFDLSRPLPIQQDNDPREISP